MGTPDAVKRLVDRLDQDSKVFLSGDCKAEQLPKAKTPTAARHLDKRAGLTEHLGGRELRSKFLQRVHEISFGAVNREPIVFSDAK